ncbi:MAG: hypothetical protein ACFE9S_16475 [Candidatus Hermodarchaeota archaeon]
MPSEFYRPSMTIFLDADFFEFDPYFVFGPGAFSNSHPILREYIHEMLHFWQTLSQYYLTDLACLELEYMIKYEKERTITPDCKLIEKYIEFNHKNPEFGFSAFNLSEALCRFWDLRIFGPLELIVLEHDKIGISKEKAEILAESEEMSIMTPYGKRAYKNNAIDFLMQILDVYSEPYRFLLERWGSIKAETVFPVIAYYALKSPSPAEVFVKAANSLMESSTIAQAIYDAQADKKRSIHHLWDRLFGFIKSHCNKIILELTDDELFQPGLILISQKVKKNDFSFFDNNIIYRHYLSLLEMMKESFYLDRLFAFPGNPDSRQKLGAYLIPPLTILRNGRWIGDSLMSTVFQYRMLSKNLNLGPKTQDLKNSDELANEAQNLTNRFLNFKRELNIIL